ncbi:MAG: hypothetical protein ACHQ6T_09440 [Myxococcota bacterium]
MASGRAILPALPTPGNRNERLDMSLEAAEASRQATNAGGASAKDHRKAPRMRADMIVAGERPRFVDLVACVVSVGRPK